MASRMRGRYWLHEDGRDVVVTTTGLTYYGLVQVRLGDRRFAVPPSALRRVRRRVDKKPLPRLAGLSDE